MMDGIRQWLLGILAAAMGLSLLYALLPKGAVRAAAKATGGLILLLAVVQPLLRVRWEELTWRYETYQREMDRQTEAYQAAYADSLSGDIADRTAAYISEKAAQLGLSCHPRVEVTWRGGVPYPGSVTLDMAENRALSAILEEDLGIPPSEQHWLG